MDRLQVTYPAVLSHGVPSRRPGLSASETSTYGLNPCMGRPGMGARRGLEESILGGGAAFRECLTAALRCSRGSQLPRSKQARHGSCTHAPAMLAALWATVSGWFRQASGENQML